MLQLLLFYNYIIIRKNCVQISISQSDETTFYKNEQKREWYNYILSWYSYIINSTSDTFPKITKMLIYVSNHLYQCKLSRHN
jgi:hypothetical protein